MHPDTSTAWSHWHSYDGYEDSSGITTAGTSSYAECTLNPQPTINIAFFLKVGYEGKRIGILDNHFLNLIRKFFADKDNDLTLTE